MSNMGFIISTHFCGGEAVFSKLGVEQEHLSCGMQSKISECESHSTNNELAKDCCENRYLSSTSIDEYISIDISIENKVFNDFIYTNLVTHPIKFQEITKASLAFYSPPYLKQNIPVLIQSFLI
jgi:hypothetical protein